MAAAIIAVPANAADRLAPHVAPAEYVRVCSAYGEGFFHIPGSSACLRVGGRVRSEFMWAEPFTSGTDSIGYRARARLVMDARAPTSFGTLRAFMRYEWTSNSGAYLWAHSNGPAVSGTFGPDGWSRAGGASLSATLEKGFIQWHVGGGVLTAGLVGSFFDFYANALNYSVIRGSDRTASGTQVLAYTASLGSGWSATIALEDRIDREFTGVAPAVPVPPGPSAFVYGGQTMPDLVAALRAEGHWGSAQISAAAHDLRPGAPAVGALSGEDATGFALQAGVKLDLSALAAGDQLWLQGAYATGAIGYLGFGGKLSSSADAGHILTAHADAIYDAGGTLHRTSGYAFTAVYLHHWSATVRQALFGSFARLDYDAAVTAPLLPGAGGRAARNCGAGGCDTGELRIGTGLVWSPIRHFDVGLELLYTRVDPRGRVFDSKDLAVGIPAGAARQLDADDAFQARLRFQYDF